MLVYSNIDVNRIYIVALSRKIFITGLLVLGLFFPALSQRIVVDTTSANKYLIKPEKTAPPKQEEELSFGDRAVSIGLGILNRLKARLNLEEAAESIKDKKDKILGTKEDEEKKEGDN